MDFIAGYSINSMDNQHCLLFRVMYLVGNKRITYKLTTQKRKRIILYGLSIQSWDQPKVFYILLWYNSIIHTVTHILIAKLLALCFQTIQYVGLFKLSIYTSRLLKGVLLFRYVYQIMELANYNETIQQKIKYQYW